MADSPKTNANDEHHLDETQSVDVVQEELVAYLDGELSSQAVERIELRLSSDESYRNRMVRLQKTWDVLDHLPRSETSESFTQSTVELVTKSIEVEVKAAKKRHRVRRLMSVGFAILFVSLASYGGYQLTRWYINAPNRQLVEDLEVIENVDLYQNADDITFLEKLAEEGLFEDEQQASE